MTKYILLWLISVALLTTIGAYSHEKDLIRQCVEDGTLYTWDDEYVFECKAIKFNKDIEELKG